MLDVPRLPGFGDPVHGAQATFRALLNALSFPGSRHAITALAEAPPDLHPACAAACLTLLDFDTRVFLSPGMSPTAGTWLRFHTGCVFVDEPRDANFAILDGAAPAPTLPLFHPGTLERPEDAATLLLQVRSFVSGPERVLRGPGVRSACPLRVDGLRSSFWNERDESAALYPRGIDVFLFTDDTVVGLPRTTRVERS